jgi:hypothetical protein
MKNKHILILSFVALFAGVALLGYNNAWAVLDPEYPPCSDETGTAYEPRGPCIDFDYYGKPAYVMVFLGESGGFYEYEIYQRSDAPKGKDGPPAISYGVFATKGEVETYRSNSGITLDELFKTCGGGIYAPYITKKVNWKVGNKQIDTFRVRGSAPDPCDGRFWAVIGDYCVSDSLPFPETGGFTLPFEPRLSQICTESEGGAVQASIEFDQCGNVPPTVEFTDASGAGRTFGYEERTNHWVVGEYEDPNDPDSTITEAHQFGGWGFDQACFQCTYKYPIILYKNTAYFGVLLP